MSSALLHHEFAAALEATPDKVALICGAERLRYADVDARANALARALLARGVRRGDRVALFLDNGVDFVAGFYAGLRIGAVVVPINPLTRRDKLAWLLDDAGASALLTRAALAPVWSSALAPCTHTLFVADADGALDDARALAWPASTPACELPAVATEEEDLAAILYTSGSTGFPKGVMHSHRSLLSALRSIDGYLRLCASDVVACALPLAFGYGLTQLLLAFRVGASVVLERNFTFPLKVLDTMVRERATVFAGVPTMFAALTAPGDAARADLGALRLVTNAGAALPEAQIARVRALFPCARLYSMYGLTECIRVSYLPPEQLAMRPTSVGRGMPGQELWLVDDAGRRLPDGSAGELVVRGAHVMQGYWRRPQETACRLEPEPTAGERVLRTGDLFRSDADGWLYFVARRDDIIKTRGEKVSPREVENAIHALAGVHEVAVIGVPDERLGQAVKAYVTLAAGAALTERDVVRHCQARLEPFMAPRQVVFVAALPRTDNGKIRKSDLV